MSGNLITRLLNCAKLATALSVLSTGSALLGMSNIDESLVSETIVVDPSGQSGYRTIGSAFDYLNEHPNLAVKVKIMPGIYREGHLRLDPRNAAATIIEGTAPEEVIVTGADVWTEWKSAGDSIFYADWIYEWGEYKYDDWHKFRNDLGRRTEIVLLDGVRMTQVATRDELTSGRYYVDEENDRLWIQIEDASAIETGRIEVAIRGQLFWLRQVSNLVLRNITFRDAANGPQRGDERFAVALFGNSAGGDMNDLENYTTNLLIDNCTFTGMNSGGVTIACYRHMLINNSRFDDNGATGAGITRVRYMTIQDSQFNENNWRVGGYGEFYDWAPAGTKILFGDSLVIKDSVFNDNMATGLWMDYHHENVLITDIVAEDNYGAGVYLEASSGPFVVTNSVMRRNGNLIGDGMNHGGILIAESRKVTISNNIIEDNGHGQIVIRTREREGSGGFFSGDRFDGSVKDITIVDSFLAGKRVTPPDDRRADFYSPERQNGSMIAMTTHGQTDWYQEKFLTTLWADNNTYAHESGEPLFSTGGEYGFERIPLEQWQADYALDMGSKLVGYDEPRPYEVAEQPVEAVSTALIGGNEIVEPTLAESPMDEEPQDEELGFFEKVKIKIFGK